MLLAKSLFEANDIAHNALQAVGNHVMWGEPTPAEALLDCLEGMIHSVVNIINEKDSTRQISAWGGKFRGLRDRAMALAREKNTDSVNAFLVKVQEHEEQGCEIVYWLMLLMGNEAWRGGFKGRKNCKGTGLEERFLCYGKIYTHGIAMKPLSQRNIIAYLCLNNLTQTT